MFLYILCLTAPMNEFIVSVCVHDFNQIFSVAFGRYADGISKPYIARNFAKVVYKAFYIFNVCLFDMRKPSFFIKNCRCYRDI